MLLRGTQAPNSTILQTHRIHCVIRVIRITRVVKVVKINRVISFLILELLGHIN